MQCVHNTCFFFFFTIPILLSSPFLATYFLKISLRLVHLLPLGTKQGKLDIAKKKAKSVSVSVIVIEEMVAVRGSKGLGGDSGNAVTRSTIFVVGVKRTAMLAVATGDR